MNVDDALDGGADDVFDNLVSIYLGFVLLHLVGTVILVGDLEKARKSKKKKPMIASMSQDEEMNFSQFAQLPHDATTTPDPFVAPPTPPAPPPLARFRIKQLIVRSPTTNTANSKDPQTFLFMPTSGFKLPRKI
ncbi:hypothetical protein PIB30_043308 [Stylosanthes scabra]|uniref:Uncharacterized protein n=1 Tax=Stylosanthes scabra TaxID=79078 RepID=A0ABU6QEX1_9FABA|nr:hypothetical protein [Stylosanthes scabra]